MVVTLAMVLYPDVQRCAQAEIDSVIGRDRLPAFEDRVSLPYIDAVLRETFRWAPAVPLGVPHAASSADIYDGYLQKVPFLFNERLICTVTPLHQERPSCATHAVPRRISFYAREVHGRQRRDDPAEYVFGLGRRIFPGRHYGEASLWSAIVTMLATMDISSAKDDQGNVIDFTPKFITGATRYPMIFPCNVSPRSHIHSERVDVWRTAEF
ncbi:cytochrome P450 [Suillus ampliporus]|nr:cytochrome P450 [Suillus ampliporus]